MAAFLLVNASVVTAFISSWHTGLAALTLGLCILGTMFSVRQRLARQLNERMKSSAV
jgi:hypothetical protein